MIEQNITIPNATASQVYETLLSSDKHSELTGDTAQVSDKVGEKFSTFGGYAEGENVELVKNAKIVQTWRASNWPEGHYSTITFELSDSGDGAVIKFTQTDLPEGTEEEFTAGWQDNYWQPLQDYFSDM